MKENSPSFSYNSATFSLFSHVVEFFTLSSVMGEIIRILVVNTRRHFSLLSPLQRVLAAWLKISAETYHIPLPSKSCRYYTSQNQIQDIFYFEETMCG